MAKAQADSKPKQTSPKQLAILAALFLVLITVGVVQFSGLLGGGDAPAQSQPKRASGQPSASNTSSTTPSQSPTGMQLPPLTPRDPFRPTIQTAQAQPQPASNKVVRNTPTPRREITGTPPVPPLTLPAGQFGLRPAEPTPTTPELEKPNYTITGVVLGPNSVAILADSEGRRRFVKQGDLLEEGWRVVSIERGQVTLRKGKQQLSVRVGESNAPNGGNKP